MLLLAALLGVLAMQPSLAQPDSTYELYSKGKWWFQCNKTITFMELQRDADHSPACRQVCSSADRGVWLLAWHSQLQQGLH